MKTKLVLEIWPILCKFHLFCWNFAYFMKIHLFYDFLGENVTYLRNFHLFLLKFNIFYVNLSSILWQFTDFMKNHIFLVIFTYFIIFHLLYENFTYFMKIHLFYWFSSTLWSFHLFFYRCLINLWFVCILL